MSDAAHICTKGFAVPFADAWRILTNPYNFPRLYPNWVNAVEQIDANTYEGTGTLGDPVIITPVLNQAYGVADFQTINLDGKSEKLRSRIIPIGTRQTLVVQIVVRSEVMQLATTFDVDEDLFWRIYVQNVNHDLGVARKFVEDLYRQYHHEIVESRDLNKNLNWSRYEIK